MTVWTVFGGLIALAIVSILIYKANQDTCIRMAEIVSEGFRQVGMNHNMFKKEITEVTLALSEELEIQEKRITKCEKHGNILDERITELEGRIAE